MGGVQDTGIVTACESDGVSMCDCNNTPSLSKISEKICQLNFQCNNIYNIDGIW